jgi:hypothetical protein
MYDMGITLDSREAINHGNMIAKDGCTKVFGTSPHTPNRHWSNGTRRLIVGAAES